MKHCFHFSAATVLLPIRHVVARLCVLCLLLVAGSAQAQTVFTVDGITYQTLTESTVQVGDGMNCAVDSFTSTISIPSTVNFEGSDYSVTNIGYNAFSSCYGLTSLSLPASMSDLQSSMFSGCSSLTEFVVDPMNPVSSAVNGVLFNKDQTVLVCYPSGKWDSPYIVPDGVTGIANSAFWYCFNLTGISFPASLTYIEGHAFRGCRNLASVSFPASLTSIGDSAFDGCESLTSLSFPDSLTTIDAYAFSGCSGLTSVTLPKSLTTLGTNAFCQCSSLPAFNINTDNCSFCVIDGVLFNKNATTLICYPKGKSGTSYTVPNGVTTIGNNAFYMCSGLTSVSFPTSLTNIETFAFYYCSGLTSAVLPESLTTIENYAFSDCSGLTSVSLPNSLTSIGSSAFSRCSSLSSVSLPASLHTLNDSVFSYCSALTSVSFPASLKTIKTSTFYYCSKLTSITLPASLTTISYSAFAQCTKLTSVSYLGATQPTIASSSFSNAPAGRTLHIPNASSGFTASKWGASSITYDLGNVNASITGPAESRWKLVGKSDWNAPDTVLSNIAIGTYQVDFSEVAGWETPAPASITVTGGGTATATGVYTEHSTPVSLSMMEVE